MGHFMPFNILIVLLMFVFIILIVGIAQSSCILTVVIIEYFRIFLSLSDGGCKSLAEPTLELIYPIPTFIKMKQFSQNELIKTLCNKRIKLAAKRRSEIYFEKFAVQTPKQFSSEIDYLIPPRSSWYRPKPKLRNCKRVREPQQRDLYRTINDQIKEVGRFKIILLLVLKKVLVIKKIKFFLEKNKKILNELNSKVWIINLLDLLIQVQVFSLFPFASIKKPIIKLITKDKAKRTFRVISSYPLKESLIIGQLSKNVNEAFDHLFLDNSYAFRMKDSKGKTPDHHMAFSRLDQFITEAARNGKEVWCAECDIKKFYDSIDHDVILDCFDKLSKKASSKNWRRRFLLKAFLRSYNFNHFGIKESDLILKQMGNSKNTVPWLKGDEKMKKYHSSSPYPFLNKKIGIPQGAAMSCSIANIVLHFADIKVQEQSPKDNSTLYLRYCDDIIILSHTKEACERMKVAYVKELETLKLPYHDFEIANYNKNWWKNKSRDTYQLGPAKMNLVPWVGYVGYQVKHNGLEVRIRKSSLNKEIQKQSEVISKIYTRIKVGGLISASQKKSILNSAKNRLVAHSLGNTSIALRNPAFKPKLCWVDGFSAIDSRRMVKTGIRRLDRSKRSKLSCLRRLIDEHNKTVGHMGNNHYSPSANSKGVEKNTGKLYSYSRIEY